MEFDYTPHEGTQGTIYAPTVPVWINGFPVAHALIDTGADVTILPMESEKRLLFP